MTPRFEIVAAGDSALVVRVASPVVNNVERIDPVVNGWCAAIARGLEQELGAAIRDAVVGYCSVTVYFDPLTTDAAWLEDRIYDVSRGVAPEDAGEGGIVDVPVCYGGELGPDLGDVAAFASCSPEEAIALHTRREYRVYLVGFVPGFAYMAEVEPKIAAPRRTSPRTAVPAGSVAIAGGQTGIYPSVTPGGWNIVGRTPLKPYDADRREPFLFRPGDRVKFRSITEAEFHTLSSEN
jgi:inhibitor of KinA